VIVPLFALANAGIRGQRPFLAQAYASPVTLGILLGYVLGQADRNRGFSWVVTRLSRNRLRPPVGLGLGDRRRRDAGIGFTVSLLIATLAFRGMSCKRPSSAY